MRKFFLHRKNSQIFTKVCYQCSTGSNNQNELHVMCIRLYIITHLVALQFIYAQKCFKDDSTNLKITLSLSLLFVHAKKHNQTQRFQSFLEGIFSTFHRIIQSAPCDKQRLSREILRQYNVEINKKRFLKIQTNHRERSSKFFKKIQYPFIVTSSSLQKLY